MFKIRTRDTIMHITVVLLYKVVYSTYSYTGENGLLELDFDDCIYDNESNDCSEIINEIFSDLSCTYAKYEQILKNESEANNAEEAINKNSIASNMHTTTKQYSQDNVSNEIMSGWSDNNISNLFTSHICIKCCNTVTNNIARSNFKRIRTEKICTNCMNNYKDTSTNSGLDNTHTYKYPESISPNKNRLCIEECKITTDKISKLRMQKLNNFRDPLDYTEINSSGEFLHYISIRNDRHIKFKRYFNKNKKMIYNAMILPEIKAETNKLLISIHESSPMEIDVISFSNKRSIQVLNQHNKYIDDLFAILNTIKSMFNQSYNQKCLFEMKLNRIIINFESYLIEIRRLNERLFEYIAKSELRQNSELN